MNPSQPGGRVFPHLGEHKQNVVVMFSLILGVHQDVIDVD